MTDDELSRAASPVADERPVDRTALVAGVLFVILGAVFGLDYATDVNVEVRFIWPLLLIGLGAAGLVSSARRT